MNPVIVVGAGLAGLSCARALLAGGREVVVVEARDRVGGRVEGGHAADGTPLELGGQWVGPSQTRIYELIAELGLDTFPTHNVGSTVVDLLGRRSLMRPHRGAVPRLGPFALADLAQGLARFNRLAARVDLERPWESPLAADLDGQTMESWVRRTMRTEAARGFFRVAAQAVFAAETTDVSLLHALFYARSGTDLDTLLATDAGAQRDRVVGGSVRIAQRLAAPLGDRVRLSSPVARVVHASDTVCVQLRSGEVLDGSDVVITLPPALAGRLDYDPVLPSWRDQLTQRLPAGSVIKTYAVYPEPFWRADGLNGQVASDRGPVSVTFDNSPPEGTPGVLVGFIEGADAREWARRDEDARRAAVLECHVRAFGPRAGEPVEYLERDWMAEEFSRGCYGAHFAPGTWTAYGHALRTSVGRVHFAGAECSPVWNGYMEGAVRSGEQTAGELLAGRS